jgi:hypothetical protein
MVSLQSRSRVRQNKFETRISPTNYYLNIFNKIISYWNLYLNSNHISTNYLTYFELPSQIYNVGATHKYMLSKDMD